MDRVEALRIEKFRLNYSLDSFLEQLEEGNLQKLSMSAKKVIDDITSYIIVEENLLASYVKAGKSASLFSYVRKQHREIHSLLSDLYTIHVTEPDGEFAKIMIEVVDKGIKRLDDSYKFLDREKVAQETSDFTPYYTNVISSNMDTTRMNKV